MKLGARRTKTAIGTLPYLIHNAAFATSENVINVGREGPYRVTRTIGYLNKARIVGGGAGAQTRRLDDALLIPKVLWRLA